MCAWGEEMSNKDHCDETFFAVAASRTEKGVSIPRASTTGARFGQALKTKRVPV
jgi:hypothetical protein